MSENYTVQNFCSNCGTQLASRVKFCPECGKALQTREQINSGQYLVGIRKTYLLTYALAGLTGFFWLLQTGTNNPWLLSVPQLLPLALSWVARVTVVLSFVRQKLQWLAVSALASTTSLVLGLLMQPFSLYFVAVAEFFTWCFSIATLTSLFLLAKKNGDNPFAFNQEDW